MAEGTTFEVRQVLCVIKHVNLTDNEQIGMMHGPLPFVHLPKLSTHHIPTNI